MSSERFVALNVQQLHPVTDYLSSLTRNYRIFLFSGNLGAGKTTLVQKFCERLGSADQVTSPTFALVNEYDSPTGTIYHFDLYRMRNAEELEDIGFTEYLDSGNICLIEWPELAMPFIDKPYVAVELAYLGDQEGRSIDVAVKTQ